MQPTDERGGYPSRRERALQRFAVLGPASLLVVVALIQIHAARVVGIVPPSKGGGFGMFACVDGLKRRTATIRWRDESGIARCVILFPTSPELSSIFAAPDEHTLKRVARKVGRLRNLSFAHAHVAVRRVEFEPDSCRLSWSDVLTVRLGDDADVDR